MIVVSGNWRSYTGWTADLVARAGDLRVAHEALNPVWHDPKPPWPRWFADTVAEVWPLALRPAGHNGPTPHEEEALRRLYSGVAEVYGGVDVVRLMYHPYWRLMRQVWPRCRIVYLSRRLRSWLSCVVRAPAAFDLVLSQAEEHPPWRACGETVARRAEDPERLALYLLGCYHVARSTHNLRCLREELGDDWLQCDGEQLCAQYEVEMPRLLDHCGVPIPDVTELRSWADPPSRVWPGPWGWRDCCEVAEAVEAHRHLIEEAVC